MGNKLKEVFDKKSIVPKIQLVFKDKNAEKKFFDKLNSGETFDATEIASVFRYKERGNEKYTYAPEQEEKLFIYPEKDEDVNAESVIEYNYKGKNKKIIFVNEIFEGKKSIRNKNNKIVELRMVFEKGKININCTANYNNASSMKEIYKEFQEMYGLMSYITKKGKAEDDYESLLKFFIMRIVYYKRVIELEKKLGVRFDPKKIENTPQEVELFELVFFWIAKNKIIKNNQRLNHISNKGILPESEWVVGNAYNITVVDLFNGDLFGVKISLYIVNCHLNAVVSNKEYLDGKTNIYFEEKDSMPMVNARKGFLTKEEAEKERDDLESSQRKAMSYQNSLYLSELSILDLEKRKNKIID